MINNDWKERAEILVINFDDAFPNCRMCNDYITACHAEFPDVPRRRFARFMGRRLQQYRLQN